MNKLKQLIKFLLEIGYQIYNYLVIKYYNVHYSDYPKIRGRIFLTGRGEIKIGKNLKINSSLSSNAIGGDHRTIFSVSSGAVLEIGDHSGISNTTIICRESVKIGDYVKIGGSVKIYDTDFHSLDCVKRSNIITDIPKNTAIIIKNHCFIGAHSIILKGVTIGEKSIVGAGAVVTKSIPDGEIWGGNPAKLIRKI